jgi:hypothetical protein
MANQYLTQAEAAVYSTVIGGLSEAVANAYLQAASAQVDNFCGRSFDTVLEELPPDVGLAVALWAEDLTTGTSDTHERTQINIGPYCVSCKAGSTEERRQDSTGRFYAASCFRRII